LADGGPLASSEADARKGSYTNAFKKAAAFFGVGRMAYEGSLDDDNLPGESMLHAFQVTDIHRDEQDDQDFHRTAGGVLRAIDAGVGFPLRGWQCKTCPFQGPCNTPNRSRLSAA
jgi:hypothetical protein